MNLSLIILCIVTGCAIAAIGIVYVCKRFGRRPRYNPYFGGTYKYDPHFGGLHDYGVDEWDHCDRD